jgi:molybdopterin converting factor subunit 1
MSPSNKSIKVQYYAILREQARCREEALTTAALTTQQLYLELSRRHGFTLPVTALRVAINADFVTWEHSLNSGDVVVFIPPVAGG